MTKSQYQRIKKLVNRLEDEALREGEDITSPGFQLLIKQFLSQKGISWEEYQEAEEKYEEKAVPKGISAFKGEKGESGKDGKTPVKEELLELIKPLIPKVKDGRDGYTPIKGKDYFDGKRGRSGKTMVALRGKQGPKGEKGDIPNIDQLEKDIKFLKKAEQKIRGFSEPLFEERVLAMTVKQQERIIEPVRRMGMGLQGQIDELRTDLTKESLWNRTDTTLSPQTANDSIDLGSGDIDTTGEVNTGVLVANGAAWFTAHAYISTGSQMRMYDETSLRDPTGNHYYIQFMSPTATPAMYFYKNSEFLDVILMRTDTQLQFRDTAIHIASLNDGHLDLTADTSIDLNGLTTVGGNLVPDIHDDKTLGLSGTRWRNLYVSNRAQFDTITIQAGEIIDSGGSISFGDENLTTAGQMGIGTAVDSNTGLNVAFTGTGTANAGYYGIYGQFLNEPTGAYEGWRHGLRGQLTSDTAENQTHGSLRGVLGILYHTGSGTVLATEGVNAAIYHEGDAGTITEGVGGIFQILHYGANGGVITTAKGGKFVVGSLGATTGTIDEAIVGSFEANAGGALEGDNLYILKLSKSGTWNHTNKYGIYDDTGFGWYMTGSLTISANNIITDTTTGIKIGTATNQKLGFWNVTPVIQRSHITDAPGDTTANNATTINAILVALEQVGILAAS